MTYECRFKNGARDRGRGNEKVKFLLNLISPLVLNRCGINLPARASYKWVGFKAERNERRESRDP